MKESLEFYYIKNNFNKSNDSTNTLSLLAYVRIGDGGYDYYLINLYLNSGSIEYDIKKIPNIFAYTKKNNIKLDKMEKANSKLYKCLIKVLWEYIYENNYTIFDISNIDLTDIDEKIKTK